ncbi:MAG: hypothetical protein RLZZ237_965 [Pseudomonadota bacterium]
MANKEWQSVPACIDGAITLACSQTILTLACKADTSIRKLQLISTYGLAAWADMPIICQTAKSPRMHHCIRGLFTIWNSGAQALNWAERVRRAVKPSKPRPISSMA